MEGRSIYESPFPKKRGTVLVMGNEGQGLSPEVAAAMDCFTSIPSYPHNEASASGGRGLRGGAESLNVAVSASILISEIRRSASD